MPSMKIPQYQELMWPALEATKAMGGSGAVREMNVRIVEEQGFSEELQAIPHGERRMSELEYRLHWARTHLKGIGALEHSARGVWAITDHGWSLTEHEMKAETKKWREQLRAGSRTSPRVAKQRGDEAVEDGQSNEMNRSQFLAYLAGQVLNLRDTWNLTEGKAFGMWFAMEYFEMEETDAFEAASFDGGNDKDIDLFYVDHEAERVGVAQLKFNAKGAYTGKKNELLGLLHTTDWLKDPESLRRDGRKDLEEAAFDYLAAVEQGYSIEYLYIYCGSDAKEVNDAARQFNVTEAGNFPSRSCRIMTLESLQSLHEDRIDQSTRVETAEIKLDTGVLFEQHGAYGRAVVTTLEGDQLRALHEQFGDRLFDRNVRLFLGARKGGVNAGIRDTLASGSDRPNFWAYNNGVTFICDQYELSPDKVVLHNFSIVNGCQTTVSLANATLAATKGVEVLVRIIAAPEKVIDSVIRFTNSQNPIRLWDLNAQDRLQKRLKKELAELSTPFLYVLRKGETRQLTSRQKKSFLRDGRLAAIPHDFNAQYMAAFRGLPSIAYKDKGKVFSNYREQVFPSQIRSEEVVLVWQAGCVANDVVKENLAEALRESDQERIEILKRGATFFVLAVMGMLLHERNGQTFLNKVKAEVVASKMTAKRLRNYAAIALEWYVEAAGDLVQAGGSVAALVRTQDGWERIRPKVLSKWKVYRVSKDVMESALPKL
jgi:hypothetical protein